MENATDREIIPSEDIVPINAKRMADGLIIFGRLTRGIEHHVKEIAQRAKKPRKPDKEEVRECMRRKDFENTLRKSPRLTREIVNHTSHLEAIRRRGGTAKCIITGIRGNKIRVIGRVIFIRNLSQSQGSHLIVHLKNGDVTEALKIENILSIEEVTKGTPLKTKKSSGNQEKTQYPKLNGHVVTQARLNVVRTIFDTLVPTLKQQESVYADSGDEQKGQRIANVIQKIRVFLNIVTDLETLGYLQKIAKARKEGKSEKDILTHVGFADENGNFLQT